MRKIWWASILWILCIILMGLTASFTILGGAGTTCVALDPTGYGSKFAGIAPFQWLYILFVLFPVAIGVLGVRAVVLLIKGKNSAYRAALTVLIAGVIVGGIHMAASRILRGGSMPVDMVVYTTVLTLIVFLFCGLPGIKQEVKFEKPSGKEQIGDYTAAIVLASNGLVILTIQFLMAPTHTISGINYADVWHLTLSTLGAGLILVGVFAAISKLHASRIAFDSR